MKKLFKIGCLLLISTLAHASEVREMSVSCESQDRTLTISVFPHRDVLSSAMVDLLVSGDWGTYGKESILVNDLKEEISPADENIVHFYFTNDYDITIDMTLDTVKNIASIVMDNEGNRLELNCKKK